MATIHQVTLSPGKDELVAGWIGAQRWYRAKGHEPRLRQLDSWRLDDPAGEVGIETLVHLDEAGPEPVTYQVPLTYRGAPLAGSQDALVGELEHPVLGHRWVYDAPHDPVYVEQLLALLRGRAEAQHGQRSDTPDPRVMGAPHPAWTDEPQIVSSEVMRGEQSNTSVVVRTRAEADGAERPLVVKLFRALSPGENPDITLQGALAAAGSRHVPTMVGHVDGAWAGPDGEELRGQLALAQEFLPGSRDAWRVVLDEIAAGSPFVPEAHDLGAVTAEVHRTLTQVLPTRPAGADDVRAQLDATRRRAAQALAEAPDLAGHAASLETALVAASDADWPALQRIHGDYHLGQVLRVPGPGGDRWAIIDFEGEPLRPLTERNSLDSPLRDIAGMLRSFDYAAASSALGPDAARDWVAGAQAAFLDGYASVARDPREHPEALTLLTLDKALYEVVYEARNRPDWLPIPVAAVIRLLADHDHQEPA